MSTRLNRLAERFEIEIDGELYLAIKRELIGMELQAYRKGVVATIKKAEKILNHHAYELEDIPFSDIAVNIIRVIKSEINHKPIEKEKSYATEKCKEIQPRAAGAGEAFT